MDLVIAGLGRMGANMARRLHQAGHHVVAYNRSAGKVRDIMAEGLGGAFTPADAVGKLPSPRIVWLMLPAGDATASFVARADGRLAGTRCAEEAFAQVDPNVAVRWLAAEGDAPESPKELP